jgi:hypothetical protein
LCALVLLAATFGAMAGPRAPTLPREAFLRQSPIFDARLSPDGRAITFLRRDEGRVAAWWQDVATGQRVRLLDGKRGIAQAWSGDGRRLWLADEERAGRSSRAMRARRNASCAGMTARRQRFYGVDARATRFAWFAKRSNAVARRGMCCCWSMRDGATRVLQEGRQPVRGVLLREDGSLAYSTAYDRPGMGYGGACAFVAGGAGARALHRHRSVRAGGLTTRERHACGCSRSMAKTSSRCRLWRAGRWTTLHRDPAGIADASALSWDWTHHDWRAIAYDGARRAWFGRDAATRAGFGRVATSLPGCTLARVHDARRSAVAGACAAIGLGGGSARAVRPDRDRTWPLFSRDDAAVRAPVPAALVIARPVTWRARDGMALHGYVYLPRGIAPAKAPLIAWLHGGPFVQVDDDFQPQVQLLVNRGYAVFLPNFRSSTGYGLAYTRAAQGDVGNGRVLHDVLDGLDTLLAQGIGDRTRQAVMGHSFGGYLSLRGSEPCAGGGYGWTRTTDPSIMSAVL